MTDSPLPRIPRATDGADDYAAEMLGRRRALCEQAAGGPLPHLGGAPVDPHTAKGNIENMVGYAQVPVGIAGPMRVDTTRGVRDVYVPMATTEGAMIASYGRGMRLLNDAGGVRARVLAEGLSQHPILVYDDAAAAQKAAEAARAALPRFREITAGITRHGALDRVEPQVIGRRLVLRLVFTTGDAIGINMAARATDLCAAEFEKETGARVRYVHGQDVEKRANARALVEGRGRSVVADATVPRAALEQRMRVAPGQLAAIARSYAVGYAQMGTQNWLVQAANGITGLFLACGQDVAYVTESATGFLDLDVTEAGDLYASVTLPSVLAGTVGGGSGQGTARECLALLGCAGTGGGNEFAEILGATVLAGELSLMAAFCSHEFVGAHESLGRNRPDRA
jgi:hydroxymethylglutaryl-CoA reductase (NADPH)